MRFAQSDFDTVIVGGGAAGCVLAARISEDRARRVLLIEAGPDVDAASPPADVASIYPLSYYNPSYLWPGVTAAWGSDAGNRRAPFSQGRGVGGSSLVMGLWALRGMPQDYDEWETFGAAGWGWRDVLPYFIKTEQDVDFGGADHGGAGPIQIRRRKREDWPPFCRTVAQIAGESGLPLVEDINTDFRDGVCRIPLSATAHSRVSSASAYLTPSVRSRENLQILTDALCSRVLFTGLSAVGVEIAQAGQTSCIGAREVIVAAGALQAPALLQRSGIGPAEHLKSLGIPVVADLCGVGANLQNHPLLAFGVHLKPEFLQSDFAGSAAFVCLRMSSNSAMFPPGDLYFSVLNRSSWNYFGQRLAVLGVVVHKPYSRGRVLIQSAHSGPPLRIDFGFLSDKRDVQRFVTGVRAACRILRDERIRSLAQNIGVVRMQGLARALTFRTIPNRLVNAGICAALPAFPWLERWIVERVLGTSPDALSADGSDERIISLLRETVTGLFHPVGTCRMGAQGDRNAVVDNCGRVFGVANLRVADASIMPSIPRANTNIPTIMIAEKIAHTINHAIA